MGKFDKILNDYNTRKNLSINRQIALDALGTHRIIKEISNLNFKWKKRIKNLCGLKIMPLIKQKVVPPPFISQ